MKVTEDVNCDIVHIHGNGGIICRKGKAAAIVLL